MADTASQTAELRRPTAWHGAGYLLVGGAIALAALPLAVLVTVGVLGTIVLVGGLLLVVTVPAARWLARAQRRRTGRWTGRSVPELYAPGGGTLATRVEGMLRDPATWRDLAWLWLIFPVGLAGMLLCWVPYLAPALARQQAGMSRRLLSPSGRAVRRAAQQPTPAPAPPPLTPGHGLVGMRERVSVLGGTVTTEPLPGGGFEVLVELPLPRENTPPDAGPGGRVAP